MLWVFKLLALSLGIAGWATYFILWFGVRVYGSLHMSFGVWGPSWITWFEKWIEPTILIAFIAILAWAFIHELKSKKVKR